MDDGPDISEVLAALRAIYKWAEIYDDHMMSHQFAERDQAVAEARRVLLRYDGELPT